MPVNHQQSYPSLIRRIPSQIYAVLFGSMGGVLLAVTGGIVSPLMAVFGLLGGLGVVLVFMLPDLGILLTVFVVPIERLGRFGSDTTLQMFSLMRIVGLLAITSLSLKMALNRIPVRYPLPLQLYSLFLCVAVISFFFAYNPVTARGHLGTLLGNLLFLVLIVNGIRSWKMVKTALYIWLMVTILIGIYQIVDWHFGQAVKINEVGTVSHRFSTTWNSGSELSNTGMLIRRAMGTTSNAAVYGINLMMTVPFFLYLAKVTSNGWVRSAVFAGLLLILYNMMLTNTRAVLLFGVFMLMYCMFAGLIRLSVPKIIGAGLSVLLFLVLLPDAIWKRVLDPANYSAARSNNISARFDLWQAGFKVGLDNWVIGAGPGEEEQIVKYLTIHLDTKTITAHNEFIQTFADVGIFGWLLFFGSVASVVVYSFRAARNFRISGETKKEWFMIACQISLITTILFGVQVNVFHFPLKGWWLVAGLVCVMYVLSKEALAEAATANESTGKRIASDATARSNF